MSFLQRNQELFGTEAPVCLVTGSLSPRVGQCVARLMHERGFQIVLHGRQKSKAVPEFAASVVYGEVQDETAVQGWVESTTASHGRVDCVVHCAAIWDPKPLEETTADDFERYFKVNTLSTALINQCFGLQMTRQTHGGVLINLGDWAVRRPYADFAAYFTSKGAIECLTQTMAVELAQRNSKVRVSAVLPGPVLLADEVADDRAHEIAQQCLLRRAGSPHDIAEAVHFLALSPFITGVALPVDGGRSVSAGPTLDISHPDV